MLREVILDTETTGLDPATGHRVVEIGAVELLNHVPTGRTYHVYLNPERDMPAEAEAVHGLSSAFLRDKSLFADIAEEFLDFVGDAILIIHNAAFDISFLNAELTYVKKPGFTMDRVIDTLLLARQKHPGSANSLDALCRRYGIDNTRRSKHGALLDSELLAEVYLELIGGRQVALMLESHAPKASRTIDTGVRSYSRPAGLPPRLTPAERQSHEAFVVSLGDQAIWKHIRS